jgi:Flp pilus assembly pilin Flp
MRHANGHPRSVPDRVRRFVRGDVGQDLIEYGLLLAFIALVAVAGLQLFGRSVAAKYTTVSSALSTVAAGANGGGGGNAGGAGNTGNAGNGSGNSGNHGNGDNGNHGNGGSGNGNNKSSGRKP